MKFTSSIIALGSIASAAAQSCNADNCLRALRAPERLAEARAFCGTYTTASAAVPTYAAAACTGDVASRVSSACSCIATSSTAASTTATSTTLATSTTTSSPVTTTSATTTSVFVPHTPVGTSYCDDATYPAIPLPTGAFDLEGYGKENPIGPVSGGAGGPTTTFKASDGASATSALVRAVTGNAANNIIVEGRFDFPARLRVGSNKSIWGAASGGTIGSNGITVISATNVVIRNLKVTGVLDNDCITVQNTTRVWIDHCDLSSSPNIIKNGPDLYDGLLDIIRASDWITISWNYFHDHYKASLVGNNDAFRDIDFGKLHLTYHHNYWRNLGTRGNAGRFGMQHLYNNYYKDFRFQALHSRSDNQMLVEANVFVGDTREALSTYGLVIPEDSPNTSPLGDYEIDGYANVGTGARANEWNGSGVNITQVGTFTQAPYTYRLDSTADVPALAVRYSGLGKVSPPTA